MSGERAYVTALESAGLVESIVRPTTLDELQDVLRSSENCLVIGNGTAGSHRPEAPVKLVHVDGLAGDPEIDSLSQTVDVPANWTWSRAEQALSEAGLTLGGLVDSRPERTIGGTLASPEVLPALWMAHTVRGACIGLRAVTADGSIYHHITSPRTASGPDLRAIFFGTVGLAGAIARVTLRAEPAAETVTLCGALTPRLQQVASEFGSLVSLRGYEGGVCARVRVGTRLAAEASAALESVGFESAKEPPLGAAPPFVMTMPWDELDSLEDVSREVAVHPLAAGPTHVAFGLRPGPNSLDVLDQWAKDQSPLRGLFSYSPEAFR